MAVAVQQLGESVAIQSSGLLDKTASNPTQSATNALLIGRFRRGRIDKPMTITGQNIKSELGFEPDNPFYQAVSSNWSRDITFDDINLPNSAGKISVFPLGAGISLAAAVQPDLYSFFNQISQQIGQWNGFGLEYRESPTNPNAVNIKLVGLTVPPDVGAEPEAVPDPVIIERWEQPLRDNRNLPWAQGTSAETQLNLINFFDEDPLIVACVYPNFSAG